MLDVYTVLNSPGKLNWDLLSDACFNTRGRGHEQSGQVEVQHQAEEMRLQRGGKRAAELCCQRMLSMRKDHSIQEATEKINERKFYHSL